jgi:hypothetical protein
MLDVFDVLFLYEAKENKKIDFREDRMLKAR